MTFNEEVHLERCLVAVSRLTPEIIVVDSHSTDRTAEIARSFNCRFVRHEFVTQADQLAWALASVPIHTDWVVRVDADEIWPRELTDELVHVIARSDIVGVYVKIRVFFMHKWMRHGGFYPNYFLRVFRRSRAHIESRYMDEHIIVEGNTVVLHHDVTEFNRKDRNFSIAAFTDKHNAYSTREAAEMLVLKHGLRSIETVASLSRGKTERKRWLKENIYQRLPLFVRPALYFIYRYFIQLGFLDGKEGLIFHFLQGFWYRFLADAKVYEIERYAKRENKSVRQAIKDIHGMDV